VTTRGIVEAALRPFLTGQIPPDAREIRVRVHELRGGLVADAVVQVLAEYVREDGRAGSTGVVLKRLNGIAGRAARIYERLVAEHALGISALPGGLVADSVVQVLAEYVREDGRAGSTGFVLKRLNGIAVREARIYERLLAEAALGFSPLLYGVRAHASGATHLCLEAVTPVEP